MLEQLQILTALPGVSGREDAVREEILRQIAPHCTYTVDALGNLIAQKKGKCANGPKIMLSAHMDEVGFIVTHIDDDGMLRFSPVGGIDARVVTGRRVYVGDKLLPASVGIRAIHQQKAGQRNAVPEYDSLYMDIGASSAEEAKKYVQLGDRVMFSQNFTAFGDGLVRSKALDNRIACALLIQLLKQEELPCDITCAFTVQEETGCIGGRTAATAAAPDIALVLETTTANDIAGVEERHQVCKLGKGPVISFMDKGAIYDSGLYRLALDTADEAGIPVQVKAAVSGGNESRSVQIAGSGVRTLAISVACRYLHSASTVASLEDITHTQALIRALLPKLAAL